MDLRSTAPAGSPAAGFFLPVRVLARRFRRRFLSELRHAFAAGTLRFSGTLAVLANPRAFARRLAQLRSSDWVVYAKPPFGGPATVFAYLARYTHRVAIANNRLTALDDGNVSFNWKDDRADGRTKVMTLAAAEFIAASSSTSRRKASIATALAASWQLENAATNLAGCRRLIAASDTTMKRTPAVDPPDDDHDRSGALPACPDWGGLMPTAPTSIRSRTLSPS